MPVTPEEIQEIASAVRSEIVAEMDRKGYVWAPRNLVEKISEDRDFLRRQKEALRKDALFFSEIAALQLWGPVSEGAVRAYADKYSKQNEIFPVPKGKLKRYKIVKAAVIRLRKKRGYDEL